jgi:hypothetical protein
MVNLIQTIRWFPALGAGWLSATLMAGPALAFSFPALEKDRNYYDNCARSLTKAKLAPEVTAKACAEVLNPLELGQCVERITAKDLAPSDATLEACRRVRRPVELAACVVDIHGQDKTAPKDAVLESCRRSLLPVRYSYCVIGLSRELAFDVKGKVIQKSLDNCLDAADRPRDLLPNFIKAGDSAVVVPPTGTTPTPAMPDPNKSATPQLY